MGKPITSLQLNGKIDIDAEVIDLLNKVAAMEYRPPTNLARFILLTSLRRRLNKAGKDPAQQAFKAAV